MTDAVTARLVDARTLLLRAVVDLDAGECKQRVTMASYAISDAIEQRDTDLKNAKLLGHLEVLADTLTTPSLYDAE